MQISKLHYEDVRSVVNYIVTEHRLMFRILAYVSLVLLSGIAAFIHRLAKHAESHMEAGADCSGFHQLQNRYFAVYFLSAFADWLQGPYVYNLYSYYGYTESQIAVLYVIGFFSSLSFGTFVGSLADKLGRKKLCIIYCILYSICCLTKASPNFEILVVGRILGGISTSILFSTFEAWYIHEHSRRNYPQEWINLTMSKSTFFNAILAIVAGVVANIAAETLNFGPVSPFMLAVPCLTAAGFLAKSMWDENELQKSDATGGTSYCKSLAVIFTSKSYNMLQLGTIQSIFESVMYTFIFLWTPVLLPMSPPLGIVFSSFMVCIMIGSSFYSFLLSKNYTAERLLTIATTLAFVSLIICTAATSKTSTFSVVSCFFAFLLYEISVGMYFPAIGYLRSRVLPEEYRAGITNWFRVPMNFLVCASLLLLRSDKKETVDPSVEEHGSSSHFVFLLCSCSLVIAIMISINFTPKYVSHDKPTKEAALVKC